MKKIGMLMLCVSFALCVQANPDDKHMQISPVMHRVYQPIPPRLRHQEITKSDCCLLGVLGCGAVLARLVPLGVAWYTQDPTWLALATGEPQAVKFKMD